MPLELRFRKGAASLYHQHATAIPVKNVSTGYASVRRPAKIRNPPV
jgi:hypothetical protein